MPNTYEHRRNWKPQNRPYEATTTMLRRSLRERPVRLMCLGCRGMHVVYAEHLVIRCACGAVTVYRQHVLFYLWTSLTWLAARLYSASHFEAYFDPYREAMRFYASAGPPVERNTETIVVTQLGPCTVNDLPVSLPGLGLRTLAWRRHRRV